jgi:hypothetical protein
MVTQRKKRALKGARATTDPKIVKSLKTQLKAKDTLIHYVFHEINEEVGQTLALVRLKLSTVETIDADEGIKVRRSIELISKTISHLRTLVKTRDQ